MPVMMMTTRAKVLAIVDISCIRADSLTLRQLANVRATEIITTHH